LFKIIIKRGERGQKMGCKIAKKKEERVRNRTISKKIGARVQLNPEMGCKIRNGVKKWGVKSLKKKGAKSHN